MNKQEFDQASANTDVTQKTPLNLSIENQGVEVLVEEAWNPSQEANSKDFDRRLSERRRPHNISTGIRIQRAINDITYKIMGSRTHQAYFVLLTLMSLALIWFSATYRIELIDQEYQEFVMRGELETEILKLNELWSEEEMAAITTRVSNADRRRVFYDYQSLANWLHEHSNSAQQLNLDFTYNLGRGETAQIDNVLEAPIHIELTPTGLVSQDAYPQIMEFMRGMVSTLWYVDIVESSVQSDGSGVKKMSALLRVWVHGQVKSDG